MTEQHTNRQTDRQTDRKAYRHKDKQIDRQTDRQTDTHTDRNTVRQLDWLTDRQSDWLRDRVNILFLDSPGESVAGNSSCLPPSSVFEAKSDQGHKFCIFQNQKPFHVSFEEYRYIFFFNMNLECHTCFSPPFCKKKIKLKNIWLNRFFLSLLKMFWYRDLNLNIVNPAFIYILDFKR